jgi:hypothetical protein
MLELLVIILVAVFFVGGGTKALWKGKIPATKTSTIEGLPARIVGLLLLLAIPLAFLAAFFYRPIVKTIGIEPEPQSTQPMLVFCAPLLACPLIAVAVGFAPPSLYSGGRNRRRRRSHKGAKGRFKIGLEEWGHCELLQTIHDGPITAPYPYQTGWHRGPHLERPFPNATYPAVPVARCPCYLGT